MTDVSVRKESQSQGMKQARREARKTEPVAVFAEQPTNYLNELADNLDELSTRIRLLGPGKCVFGKYLKLDCAGSPDLFNPIKAAFESLEKAVARADEHRKSYRGGILAGTVAAPAYYKVPDKTKTK